MDSLSPGRIYGTTCADTGNKWRRLVPPPLFPTLWLAGFTVSKCAHDKTDILFKAAVNQAFLSICTRASKRRLELVEEVDEDKERHGADWQGTKQPYQLALRCQSRRL